MADYAIRMLLKPEDWSPYPYQVKEAWLVLFARADSEQAAAKLMNEELNRGGWHILRKEKGGELGVSGPVGSAIVERGLSARGVFAEIHIGHRRNSFQKINNSGASESARDVMSLYQRPQILLPNRRRADSTP